MHSKRGKYFRVKFVSQISSNLRCSCTDRLNKQIKTSNCAWLSHFVYSYSLFLKLYTRFNVFCFIFSPDSWLLMMEIIIGQIVIETKD